MGKSVQKLAGGCGFRASALGRCRGRRGCFGFTAEADLYGQFPALLRVVWRDHRIVDGQIPAHAIVLWRQVMVGGQMLLEHLEPLPVLDRKRTRLNSSP